MLDRKPAADRLASGAPKQSVDGTFVQSTGDPLQVFLDRLAEDPQQLHTALRGTGQRFGVGDRVGEFVLLRRIGAGGMGEVFEAEQRVPKRRVAIKVLHPECLGAAGIRRLHFEATLLAHAHHPGIVTVFAAGVADDPTGLPTGYLAMELVAGGLPITSAAERANLDLRSRIELFHQLAEAVGSAHRAGVVHLDLKPTNALVGDDSKVKLIDFGLARALEGVVPRTDRPSGTTGWIGTYEYMAPEQFANAPVACDARADVYSLGVILFELLTRRRPFDLAGLSPFGIGNLLTKTVAPRASSLAEAVPEALNNVTSKCLEPLPKMRYRDAAELAMDIRRWLDDEQTLAKPLGTRDRCFRWLRIHRRFVAVAASLSIGLIAGSLGFASLVSARHDLSAARQRLSVARKRDASVALGRGQLVLAASLSNAPEHMDWESRSFGAIPPRPMWESRRDGPIFGASFCFGDSSIAVCTGGRGVEIERLMSGTPPETRRVILPNDPRQFRVTSDGAFGVLLSVDNRATVVNLQTGGTIADMAATSFCVGTDTPVVAIQAADVVAILSPLERDRTRVELPLPPIERTALGFLGPSTLFASDGHSAFSVDINATAPTWIEIGTPIAREGGPLVDLIPSTIGLLRITLGGGLELLDTDGWRSFPDTSYGPGVTAMALSHNASRLAIGLANGAFAIVELKTAQVSCNTSAHSTETTSLSWSSDDRYLMTGAADGRLAIWPTAQTAICPRSDSQFSIGESVADFDASEDGSVLALMDDNGIVTAMRVRPSQEVLLRRGTSSDVRRLAVSPAGNLLFWVENDCLVRCDVASGADRRLALAVPAQDIFVQDDSLFVYDENGGLDHFSSDGLDLRWRIDLSMLARGSVRFVGATNSSIVLQSGGPSILGVAIDKQNGHIRSSLRRPAGLGRDVVAVAYSESRDRWYLADTAGIIHAFPETSSPGTGLRTSKSEATAGLRFTTDETRLIAVGPRAELAVLDPTTLELIAWFEGSPFAARFAEFSPQTQVLTIAGSNGRARQYNAPSPFRQPEYVWEPVYENGRLSFRRPAAIAAQLAAQAPAQAPGQTSAQTSGSGGGTSK